MISHSAAKYMYHRFICMYTIKSTCMSSISGCVQSLVKVLLTTNSCTGVRKTKNLPTRYHISILGQNWLNRSYNDKLTNGAFVPEFRIHVWRRSRITAERRTSLYEAYCSEHHEDMCDWYEWTVLLTWYNDIEVIALWYEAAKRLFQITNESINSTEAVVSYVHRNACHHGTEYLTKMRLGRQVHFCEYKASIWWPCTIYQ